RVRRISWATPAPGSLLEAQDRKGLRACGSGAVPDPSGAIWDPAVSSGRWIVPVAPAGLANAGGRRCAGPRASDGNVAAIGELIEAGQDLGVVGQIGGSLTERSPVRPQPDATIEVETGESGLSRCGQEGQESLCVVGESAADRLALAQAVGRRASPRTGSEARFADKG